MGKTVYVAEKPSLGRDIAKALGGGQSRDGYIEGTDWIVTWVFGHVMSLVKSEYYDPKYKIWHINNLPILPEKMVLEQNKDAKKQIATIKKLISNASSVVHCGDAGREGQLLIDEVLEEVGNNKPTKRLWINKMTDSGFKEAIRNAKPAKIYKNLSDASVCRRDFDWIVGFNFSPLFTLVGKATKKSNTVQNIGRVMTPTLRMVVDRDNAIKDFVPKDFYEVLSSFSQGVTGKWKPSEELLDQDGYLTDKQIAEEAARKTDEFGQGEVSYVEYKTQKSNAPMPFTLGELQKECNRKMGWSLQKTLGIAQSLYEVHKMTTYPRTESPYLAEEQKGQAEGLIKSALSMLKQESLLDQADFSQHHPVFNDKKLGEHHAIIPTGESAKGINSLSDEERIVFEMVTKRYLAVFYPPKITKKLSATISVSDLTYAVSGSQITHLGWAAILGKGPEDTTPLPSIKEGDILEVLDTEVQSKKTSPPSYFTEDSLLSMMEKPYKLVEGEEDKNTLKEVEGIGTAATRGAIIDKLCKLGFIKRSKKKLVSTPKGQKNIEISIEALTSPALTAEWERRLKAVEKGELKKEDFMKQVHQWISSIVDYFKANVDFSSLGDGQPKKSRPPSEKQLNLAQKIADDLSIQIPEEALKDSYACSKFIDTHIKKAKEKSKRPPSEKQLAFAQKLSEETGVKITQKAKTDSMECSKFIDRCLQKSKRK